MTSVRLAGLSSIINNLPGPGEIEAILGLLPQASLLVDAEHQKIVISNKISHELSQYTREELEGLDLHTLLPNAKKLSNVVSGDKNDRWETVLIQRSGMQIVVRVRVLKLNTEDQWYLLLLARDLGTTQNDIEHELDQQRNDALALITRAIAGDDLQTSLLQMLQAGQVLSGATILGIYLPVDGSQEVELATQWGQTGILPTVLPFIEIDHLRLPHLWKPGKRVISQLHQKALIEKIQYLGSIPLEKDDPQLGLLVIGGQMETAQNKLFEYLTILSSAISVCRQNNTLVKGLENHVAQNSFNQGANQVIQDAISDGMIFTDPQLRVVSMNVIAETTLGYSSEEVNSEPLANILISPNSLIEHLEEAAAKHGVQDLGHIKLHRRDGQLLLAHIRLVPLYENEVLNSIAILISDLSQYEEYKAKTKQLEQQALLGEVTAIFAHEVRNPINNISTGLQLMAMKIPEEDPIQNQIANLKQDCDRLADLMTSVLSFSKSREYRMEAINIEEYLVGILARWQPRLSRYHISHRVQVAKDTPPVYGDRRALEQVFTNLISNAIEAMKGQEEGTLALKAEHKTLSELLDVVQIDISDTGPGIPPNIQKRIFEPFFTTNSNGTGLGLAITKRIITAHNGQITVNSFPGGTVFQLSLPVADL